MNTIQENLNQRNLRKIVRKTGVEAIGGERGGEGSMKKGSNKGAKTPREGSTPWRGQSAGKNCTKAKKSHFWR